MKVSLSVLITYHDEKELLTECLSSLADQELPPDEALVYDDASIEPPARYLPRKTPFPVRIIRGETNRGPAHGRNRLLKEAVGDFVHFHDSDDWFLEGWAKRVRAHMDAGIVDVVFTEISSFDAEQRLLSKNVLGLERLGADGDLLRFCVKSSMLVPSGTYRRRKVLEMGGYCEDLWQSEDYYFHARLALTRPKFELVLEPSIAIRVHEYSRSRRETKSVLDSTLKAMTRLASELPEGYGADLAGFAHFYGTLYLKYGYPEEAKHTFAFADRLGPPSLSCKHPFYRFLARRFGYFETERIACFLRKHNLRKCAQ